MFYDSGHYERDTVYMYCVVLPNMCGIIVVILDPVLFGFSVIHYHIA